MKMKSFCFYLLLVISLISLNFFHGVNAEDPPPGSPPENSTTWIIVDGPGAGIQIHSEPDLEELIEPDVNPTTFATGDISGPEEKNCPGPLNHYHGRLLGKEDPAPTMCGWGHVIRFDAASENVQRVSSVVSLEIRAKNKISKEPEDLEGATADINDSISELKELIRNLKTNKTVNKRQLMSLVRRLKTVVALDTTASHELKRAQKEKDSEKKKKIIEKLINLLDSAYKIKSGIVIGLAEKELESTD